MHELTPTAARHRAVVARILENWNLVITKRVPVTRHYSNSRSSVLVWQRDWTGGREAEGLLLTPLRGYFIVRIHMNTLTHHKMPSHHIDEKYDK